MDRTQLAPRIAQEISVPPAAVLAVLELLGEGATVPFIARYRKERTGGLDEVQIRTIQERGVYLVELEDRRQAILESVREQGKLDPKLELRIRSAQTKAELEDLYLPFKQKRRTKATIARERGLEPLAQRILAQPPEGDVHAEAAKLVDPAKEVPDVEAAIEGAREIVIETISEHPDVRSLVREEIAERGVLRSERARGADPNVRTSFEDYYEHEEPVAKIPSHRFLAIRRGEEQGVLRAKVGVDEEALESRTLRIMKHAPATPFAGELATAAEGALKKRLLASVETDVRVDLKLRSDREAATIFADNLRNLLMAAPLGPKRVVGIDPGLRTGCKCVAVDETGKYLETITIYPSRGKNEEERAKAELLAFVKKHAPHAVAIGNGTGGRETEQLAREVLKAAGMTGTGKASDVIVVSVSEAGASVYSASDVAREEFPDLDLTIRGAISIARRLQDPLAELVKIDPKSIGVGQYQHDVYQPLLARKLGDVVESCVNQVGVELNTASASLLSYVAGVGESLAKKIVLHRDQNGPFPSRHALLKVSGIGPRAFEQAGGFLRVAAGAHPLDASGVHPERYALVERIAKDLGVSLTELLGDAALVDRIDVAKYVGEGVGEPTLRDIQAELKKPGRDPRSSFEPPKFREDVSTLQDLAEGMQLEGVVTNVTAFGAFVDVGVHQDGLVHISQLSDRFVKDPREVVKVGDKISVRVVSVDLERKRIALTAKTGAVPKGDVVRPQGNTQRKDNIPRSQPREAPRTFSNNPFANLVKK